jgi:tetratricopeptide (TPR) repeat protein
MPRQKYIAAASIVCLLLSLSGVLNAGGNIPVRQTPNEQVYRAFISERMAGWDHVILKLSSNIASLSDKQLGELVNYYYGYTGWVIGEGLKKKASRYIEEGEAIVDQLLLKHPGEPEWHAYKAAFIAYKISINKMKAAFLAKESTGYIDRAIDLGPDCQQGWVEKGNAMFYTPKLLGGSKEEAIQAYKKAIRIMEKDPESIHHNWLYLNVLMMLGQSYDKTGNTTMANHTYKKILQIEPDFIYIRDELYPAFLKSLNSRD